uniref:BolA-like protein n=1 Tax=Aplanochytrium stocchinoi TaxID=215587 RepID=A0A7S3PNY5_9STRA|mmetsp:Transcript_12771/g.15864  ORF Transcript_12771/g.15864 Transcript_12771/m.15864 type:complete len:120 (-) Transcript_12771:198-557(-)|eukprot:CAMPEP_0204851074 /NCGR_PEP_ID=MMETSP1347-20130617/9272_1 /ASSEMBLY_ACC=CAM_ASM_000690 /TAXON_ID=215587 /ORGANISM="Aplanochytrium stocchinoi, Strain GSBS06" /LENGTH=119 /DNA_ID=CAMNT_0051994445 /DNA_START=232 /DNA_END=591 /DNA_ORIENTATION=-
MPDTSPEEFTKKCARLLQVALSPLDHLCLVDVSDGHTVEGFKDGRAHKPDGVELFVLAVSENFVGKSPVERHQMVNNPLREYFATGDIHAMQIRAWTPKQWDKKGKPLNLKSKACSSLL